MADQQQLDKIGKLSHRKLRNTAGTARFRKKIQNSLICTRTFASAQVTPGGWAILLDINCRAVVENLLQDRITAFFQPVALRGADHGLCQEAET
jgi:hypothetical protein